MFSQRDFLCHVYALAAFAMFGFDPQLSCGSLPLGNPFSSLKCNGLSSIQFKFLFFYTSDRGGLFA